MLHSDVIGSLLRPNYLKEASAARERGDLSDAAFKCIEDRAVNEAIDAQTAAGLDVITDGEMRRYAFYGHMIYRKAIASVAMTRTAFCDDASSWTTP
jgi:5-methyltetrahydropteroyltriglutamate--homocysteine methyltransferase